MFLFFSKNEILEISVSERYKTSIFSNLDIIEKSLTLQRIKYNILIFLFFSNKEISEIFELLTFKIFNFSNFYIGIKSLIFLQ